MAFSHHSDCWILGVLELELEIHHVSTQLHAFSKHVATAYTCSLCCRNYHFQWLFTVVLCRRKKFRRKEVRSV